MPTEMRAHLELQTFTRDAELTSLMSSLCKMRTASITSNAGATGPTPMEIGWIKNKGKGKVKEKGKERGKEKGKGKERRKGKKDDKTRRSSRDGVATADSGPQCCQLLALERKTSAPDTNSRGHG